MFLVSQEEEEGGEREAILNQSRNCGEGGEEKCGFENERNLLSQFAGSFIFISAPHTQTHHKYILRW